MTKSVTYPAPLFNVETLDQHVLAFVRSNPEGVRNSEVGRAIGYNDTRQWFSYGVLERLQRAGLVQKRYVGQSAARYFAVEG
jgi:hypothetical protein